MTYLKFKVNLRHIGEGVSVAPNRNSLFSNRQLSCVEKKIVLVTRESTKTARG